MKRLIVNADDFGFTRGVNAGIIRAFKSGILTSATIMANGDAFEGAIEMAHANPGLAVGCHLAVVGGRPVAPPRTVSSLLDSGGFMPRTLSELILKIARGAVKPADIEREFRAQVERVLSANIKPTHLDTHKHSHVHPRVMEAVASVGSEFHIKRIRNPFENIRVAGPTARSMLRVYLKQRAAALVTLPRAAAFRRLARKRGLRAPDYFCGVSLTGLLDSEAICKLMQSMKEGVTELMCHPGAYDEELERAPTRLKRERERELEALLDPASKKCATEQKIALINYGDLV